MNRDRKIASPLIPALSLSLVSVFGIAPRANARTAALAQSAPASNSRQASSEARTRPVKEKFTVMRMLYDAIQVRGIANPLENHTFSYSAAIRDKMQKLFSRGGYQYGDQVEIWYEPGADLALKISGKRSKSH